MQGSGLHKTFYELLIWIRRLIGILFSAPGNVERANATRDAKDNDQRFQLSSCGSFWVMVVGV